MNLHDRWEHGDPYDRYVGRWSRKLAPLFLDWLGQPPGKRWLDVGCGTGSLCEAVWECCSPSPVVGIEPSEAFAALARERLGSRAQVFHGTAESIPLPAASIDIAVSALVLNFVPNPRNALLEMARVVGSGGTIGAYVWDYADGAEFIRRFWDAAAELDPAAAGLHEGRRFPISAPEPLGSLFSEAGLSKVEVCELEIPSKFEDFEDYWMPFLGGQGPAPTYLMSLTGNARESLRTRLQETLPTAPDGSITLRARIWAAKGDVG